MDRIRQALSTNRVDTSRDAEDLRLRGRTYAIPFERVWSTALALATEGRGWTVIRADDQDGLIQVEVRRLLVRVVDEVTIRVALDLDAQTRVDITAVSPKGRWDLGVNARRVGRFLQLLDRRLEASPGQILS